MELLFVGLKKLKRSQWRTPNGSVRVVCIVSLLTSRGYQSKTFSHQMKYILGHIVYMAVSERKRGENTEDYINNTCVGYDNL